MRTLCVLQGHRFDKKERDHPFGLRLCTCRKNLLMCNPSSRDTRFTTYIHISFKPHTNNNQYNHTRSIWKRISLYCLSGIKGFDHTIMMRCSVIQKAYKYHPAHRHTQPIPLAKLIRVLVPLFFGRKVLCCGWAKLIICASAPNLKKKYALTITHKSMYLSCM